jgi:hypothetical protein
MWNASHKAENTSITILAEADLQMGGKFYVIPSPSYKSGSQLFPRAKLNALHLGARKNTHNRVERLDEHCRRKTASLENRGSPGH